MVSSSEPHTAPGTASPLEWRRRFFDGIDSAALVFATVGVIGAAVLLFVAMYTATVQNAHPSVVVAWSGGFIAALASASTLVIVAGAVPRRRNRVRREDGAHTCAGPGAPSWIALALFWLGQLCIGLGMIIANTVGALQLSGSRQYPVLVASVIAMVAATFWTLAFGKLENRLEFDPLGLTCDGALDVHIPWDAILATGVYSGPSKNRPFGLGRRTEIWLTTTGELDVPASRNPDGTLSFAVDLGRLTVDEDTLFNVIVSARDHPEVRPLLGKVEGDVLFDGPPHDTRAALSRSQVWLPWERHVLATLGGDAD